AWRRRRLAWRRLSRRLWRLSRRLWRLSRRLWRRRPLLERPLVWLWRRTLLDMESICRRLGLGLLLSGSPCRESAVLRDGVFFGSAAIFGPAHGRFENRDGGELRQRWLD